MDPEAKGIKDSIIKDMESIRDAFAEDWEQVSCQNVPN